MRKVIVTLAFKGIDKLKAIKTIRQATGMSLKESRDFVDSEVGETYHRHVQRKAVQLSMEQFGEIIAMAANAPDGLPEVYVHGDVQIVEPSNVVDLSTYQKAA